MTNNQLNTNTVTLQLEDPALIDHLRHAVSTFREALWRTQGQVQACLTDSLGVAGVNYRTEIDLLARAAEAGLAEELRQGGGSVTGVARLVSWGVDPTVAQRLSWTWTRALSEAGLMTSARTTTRFVAAPTVIVAPRPQATTPRPTPTGPIPAPAGQTGSPVGWVPGAVARRGVPRATIVWAIVALSLTAVGGTFLVRGVLDQRNGHLIASHAPAGGSIAASTPSSTTTTSTSTTSTTVPDEPSAPSVADVHTFFGAWADSGCADTLRDEFAMVACHSTLTDGTAYDAYFTMWSDHDQADYAARRAPDAATNEGTSTWSNKAGQSGRVTTYYLADESAGACAVWSYDDNAFTGEVCATDTDTRDALFRRI